MRPTLSELSQSDKLPDAVQPTKSGNVYRRETCRLCAGTDLLPVLNLTSTPPANEYISLGQVGKVQDVFPLELMFCEVCAHVQLHDVVNPERLFRDYVYVSGTTQSFQKHFGNLANWINKNYRSMTNNFVVDIGSNDGTLLRHFQKLDWSVLGIDPAEKIAHQASTDGIETWPHFFDKALSQKIVRTKGRANVVTANNVFAHIDDLGPFIAAVYELLSDDGVFIFEVSYLVDVFEKTLFDTIYHEHLDYHSVLPLQKFFADKDMELINVERISSHGGSLRGVAQRASGSRKVNKSVAIEIEHEKLLGLDKPATLLQFGERIKSLGDQLGQVLRDIKSQGKSIAGYGAPAKLTTLMYHFDLGSNYLDYIVDDNPLKHGLYTPGKHIPIVASSELSRLRPDYILILAWNFAENIIKNNPEFTNNGGHFIVPLPTLEII